MTDHTSHVCNSARIMALFIAALPIDLTVSGLPCPPHMRITIRVYFYFTILPALGWVFHCVRTYVTAFLARPCFRPPISAFLFCFHLTVLGYIQGIRPIRGW